MEREVALAGFCKVHKREGSCRKGLNLLEYGPNFRKLDVV